MPGGGELQVRAQHLNRILERERTRADRSGRPLSMVLLGYDGKSSQRKDAAAIVHLMQKRGRITDEIGWFDKKTGFAVLPDTPVQGGRRFAEIVQQQLRERGIRTSFAIYQYDPPREDDPSDRDQHDGGHRFDQASKAKQIKNGSSMPSTEPALASSFFQADPEAHELRPLMARRLPVWKRGMDLAVSGTALFLLWPAMIAIGIAIKVDSPGPVIFKQKRSGLGGKPFGIWKFRTMCNDAEAKRNELLAINEQDGPAFKIKADPRITRVGGFLRKTSLDELPQLVNIFKGDMTLVGPRPLPVHESDACEPWQKRRLDITPGLTCIWQVWGRSTVNFNDWVRMDLRYKRKRTPQHDLKIMLHTVPAVLKQRGAC
ncbi:sugar transferase [Algisphaera agarilytica]|uniref:sugar transferase n=1 Tax=Algisphaera agarilytica TaxID=1385975 RepID=UPI0028F4327B|nr:sugar transferase [Algisphaera agarilytica]